ncbi:Panacea domain-containing protein [Streptococcus sp. zg-JUN1979]|uniref:Panacea domain-containing protein n=1 Tax=Streptococcus sp. zg-JUN1979 TaxID=3391450 RepID=UPI0039A745A9
MYQHFILVASSYVIGSRLGFHLVAPEGQLDNDIIESMLKRLNDINRDDIGIHSFTTDSNSWESVIKLDSFFQDIIVCTDFDEFENRLLSDSKLSALDVAKFFLVVQPISHLKLQKLIYLAYKLYLINYQQPLFDEKIIAFQYGPVIEEVYHKFKQYGSETITIDDQSEYILENIHLPQALGRMFLIKDSEQIIDTLLDTLTKYGDLSARQLVDLTHSAKGPWDTVYKPSQNCEITDDIILSQADYETL